MEQLIDPAIADLQHEHDEATRSGHAWRARFLRVVGCAAVWKVAAIAAVRQAIVERTADEDRTAGRAVAFSFIAVLVLTAFLLLPVLQSRVFRLASAGTASWLVLYSVPSALVVTLPLGLVFGILLALRNRVSTARVIWTIAAFMILCSAVSFFTIGWLMPATNQAFRELAAGRRILRGLNELTLGELASGDPARVMRLISGGVTSERLSWEFHLRIALALAPLMLGLFSLGVAATWRRNYGAVHMGVAALTTSFGYYALLFYARRDVLDGAWLPPMMGAWAPNLVFIAITLLLFHRLRIARRESYQ